MTRRRFVQAAAISLAVPPMLRAAEPAAKPTGETLVQQLYGSLNEAQRQSICFPFDHKLRFEVDNNWHIVDGRIASVFNPDQQDLVKQIFNALHSEQYAASVMQQVEHDNGKPGFGGCSVAIFGEPGTGKFEFVLTGRHVTRRCDGDSVEGAAFGGPIFYGHAARSFNESPQHEDNIYWYQAKRANEVLASLDGKQRAMALRTDARDENGLATVNVTGKREGLAGIPCSELSPDQKQLVRNVMADLLAPFRKVDADESMKLIEAGGGIDALAMSFYSNMDIGNDGVMDVWQLEGPNMVWYFRGKPHVHTWVNIKSPA
ncbi:MAG: DUF3500 domain-containing protein [Planctomycetes bacterium]|nr:DUF3500 domain-containing protein [Planctomycetota bacterium]